MNQPWIRWYPGDWRRDPGLACVSLAARGLWIELLMAMHDCEPVGTLAINGRAPTPHQVAALVRSTVADVEAGLAELEDAGVFSRDAEGRICSRRMARDAEDAERISGRLARAGAIGAAKRWGGHAEANGQAIGQAIATARARANSDSDSVSDSESVSGEGIQGERVEAPEPVPPKRPRKEPTGPEADCRRWWDAEWSRTRLGTVWKWNPRQAAAVAKMVSTEDGNAAEVQRRMTLHLESTDAWTAQRAKPSLLLDNWNDYAVEVVPTKARTGPGAFDHLAAAGERERAQRAGGQEPKALFGGMS